MYEVKTKDKAVLRKAYVSNINNFEDTNNERKIRILKIQDFCDSREPEVFVISNVLRFHWNNLDKAFFYIFHMICL